MDREKVIEAVEEAFDLVHSDFIGTDDFDETEWEKNKANALTLLRKQEGLMRALDQSNAVNGYLNAEIERLNGLLKEQEAVEPKEGADPNESHWNCGACGYPLWEDENYCAHCGRLVKWNG